MMEILIAMTNVISQHTTNQALLASLAEPLTSALASFLCALPVNSLSAASKASVTQDPVGVGTHACSSPAGLRQTQTQTQTPRQPHSRAAEQEAGALMGSQPVPGMSALTMGLQCHPFTHHPTNRRSLLPARAHVKPTLQKTALATHTARRQNTRARSHAHSRVPQRPSTAAAFAAMHPLQSSDSTAPFELDFANSVKPVESRESVHGFELPQKPDSAFGGDTVPGAGSVDDLEALLAKRFTFHVLLHLPADIVRERAGLWMQHAWGLPKLMRSCLGLPSSKTQL